MIFDCLYKNDSAAARLKSGVMSLSLFGLLVTQSLTPVWAQQLKAIDPSTLKLDDGPGPNADSSSGQNFNKTPIQGRPLGSTFQPINQSDNGQGANPPPGFGALAPVADEPVATAQDEERVNNLEQKAFGCNYHEHEVPDRLDHLEKEVLGAAKGGPIPERIARLEMKLLGGTGFGGAPASAPVRAQQPQQAPPVAYGDSGGNGFLTQAPGTPMQAPPQSSSFEQPAGPGQSELMQPSSQSMPQQIPQQGMQAPLMPQSYPPPQQVLPPMQSVQPPPPMQQRMPSGMQQPQILPQQSMPPQMAQQRMLPQQQMPQPYNQGVQNYGRPPQQIASNAGMPAPRSQGLTADAMLVANSLFYDVKSGDYLSSIRSFPGPGGQPGQSYAHWRNFPVRMRLPKESPESWQRALEAVVARWDQYVPVKMALPLEAASVEVTWVNQLPPRTLAVTRLNIVGGDMRVTIYLLRPSFYPPEIPERTLSGIFMHEVGHALGLFGHSDRPGDLMYPAEIQPASKGRPTQIHFAPVSTRDINTLKKIYESPAVPPGVSLEQPLEWAVIEPQSHFKP